MAGPAVTAVRVARSRVTVATAGSGAGPGPVVRAAMVLPVVSVRPVVMRVLAVRAVRVGPGVRLAGLVAVWDLLLGGRAMAVMAPRAVVPVMPVPVGSGRRVLTAPVCRVPVLLVVWVGVAVMVAAVVGPVLVALLVVRGRRRAGRERSVRAPVVAVVVWAVRAGRVLMRRVSVMAVPAVPAARVVSAGPGVMRVWGGMSPMVVPVVAVARQDRRVMVRLVSAVVRARRVHTRG